MSPDTPVRHAVFIFGPPAVGKMTVGQELARLTGFRLFHNHLAIECVLPVFGFDRPEFQRLVRVIRTETFRAFAQSDLPGIVFTFVWAFNYDTGAALIDEWTTILRDAGVKVDFVELRAELATRLDRNRSANRLHHKASKRDVTESERILLDNEKRWRMTSREDDALPGRVLVLDNTHLSPELAARSIAEFIDWHGPGVIPRSAEAPPRSAQASARG